MAASLQLGAAARIRLAAALDPEALPACLLDRATEQVETALDPTTGAVVCRSRLRLGALVLRDRTRMAAPGEVAHLLAAEAAARLRRVLDWSDAACQLQARVTLARAAGLDPSLPDLTDAALARDVQDWLEPSLAGCTRLAELIKLDLRSLLAARLSRSQSALLERQLPTHLALPGGRAAIDYTGPVPQAAARVQAFYGLDGTPKLAEGAAGLAPGAALPGGASGRDHQRSRRILARSLAETRRDLRGRYPKHHWPENPAGETSG